MQKRKRIVSIFLVASMLSTMWQPTVAVAEGTRQGPRSNDPPARIGSDWVLTRLAPVAAEWLRSEGQRAATVLFDGDQATSLQTGGDARIRVTLAGPRPVRGIGVFGRAHGRLSVSTVDGGRETPVAGMQDLDLRALPLRWNRFWVTGAPQVAAELVLRWRPASPAADLRELEIFGDGPDALADQGPALADRVVAGTTTDASEAWAEPEGQTVAGLRGLEEPTVFRLRLPGDPRLMGRAFLVYELARRPHWSTIRRQVNGFSVQGGAGDEPGEGGLQVEEISPEWLFRGDNEINFFSGDEGDPVGYDVRRVRIVAVAGSGDARALADGTQQPPPASSELARLSDGDPRTGLRAGKGLTSIVVPIAQGQPAAVNLRVAEKLSGHLLAATVRADGRPGRQQELDVTGLGPGWHTLPLDQLAPGSAVRLTWSSGREAAGLISEVRVGSSPPADGHGRRLVVSYPLHGECVDHRVYVRGFVTGAAADPKPPVLFADGAVVVPGIAPDGAFAFLTPEAAAFRGRRWNIVLRAQFADGGELRREVAVDACGDRPPLVSKARKPGEPKPLVEDEGAPFGKMVDADQGAELAMGGARINIPGGALDSDTRVTIRPIAGEQVAPLDDPLMENITPDRRGFRFGPHNLTFGKPAIVSIPYERDLADGAEPDELGIFFFDDDLGRWQALPTEKKGRVLVAETTHFSDFIAATLKKPDHPTAVMNTPNTIRDLKLGDPTAGMTIIQPPTPNSEGTARITFPIPLPPGRNGMQPNIDLTYSSDSGNGLLGMGWSLPQPNIQADSKLGVQRALSLPMNEDRFLLNGEEIVPVSGQEPLAPRRFFKRRVEGAFEKISRESNDGGWWIVTDKNGTKHEYGWTETMGSVRATIDIQDNNTNNGDNLEVYAALVRSTDTFGNVVEYTYTKNRGSGMVGGGPSNNSAWNELLPASITYTANPSRSQTARFRVMFDYAIRPDIFSSARLGREVRTRNRLSLLRIENFDITTSTWKIFRRYAFGYRLGEFGKSLLAMIVVDNGDPAQVLHTHKFEYQKVPRPSNDRPSFGNPQVWGSMDQSGSLGRGRTLSAGAAGFAGVGPPLCYPHIGGGMSGGAGTESTSEIFQDINGDGLPDVLRSDGRLFLNGLQNAAGTQGTFTSSSVTNPGVLGESYNWSRTFGLGIHVPGEFGGDLSTTSSHSVQTKGVMDMNGDGLPDLFIGNQVACNAFPGSTCNCGGFPGSTCAPSSSTPGSPFATFKNWSGGNASFPVFVEPAQHGSGAENSSFKSFVFARWTAPFAGNIKITGGAQRVSTQATNGPQTDPVNAFLFMRVQDPGPVQAVIERTAWTRTFTPTDTASCAPLIGTASQGTQTGCASSSGTTMTVLEGDQLYFIVGSYEGEGNKRNALFWNPAIQYTDAPCAQPGIPRGCPSMNQEPGGGFIYSYVLGNDFALAGGPYRPWVTASADTRSDNQRPTPTTVRITGDITKSGNTADDLTFRILRLRPENNGQPPVPSVVWQSDATMPFKSKQTGTFALNLVVDVRGKWVFKADADDANRNNWTVDGDQLVFQVLSDGPFDATRVDWKPVVTYQNFCAPDAARQATWIRANPGRMPSPLDVPTICTNDPQSLLGTNRHAQTADVQLPSFRSEPRDPALTGNPLIAQTTRPQPIYLFNDTATHTLTLNGSAIIDPGTDVGAPDGSQVVLLVQTPTELLAKKVITFTGSARVSQQFNVSNISVRGDVPIFLTSIAYGLHRVTWDPVLVDASNGAPFFFTSTKRQLFEAPLAGIAFGRHGGPIKDNVSGGHRQWGYGVFNGDQNLTFTTSVARSTINPLYVPARPAVHGLGINNLDLPFANNTKVWAGPAGDDYIGPGVFHPSFSGAGAIAASQPPGASFRRSTSSNSGKGVNVGVSVNESTGYTLSELELVDMNGDRLPDLLGLNKVLINNLALGRQAGFRVEHLPNPISFPFGGTIRRSDSRNIRFGVGLGSVASQIVNQPTPGGATKSIASNLPSFGLAYGTTSTSIDLVDINGDGLPDHVYKNATGNLAVRLGLGIHSETVDFQPASTDPAHQTWTMPAMVPSTEQFTNYRAQVPSGFNPPSAITDVLRLQNNASNSLQINIAGAGGGLAYSVSRTLVDLIDLNGDGLPDRVMKLPGVGGILFVQWNYGLGFTSPQEWTLPNWNTTIDGSVFTDVGLGSNDALAFSQTRSLSVSAGGIFPIPLLFICLMAEASVQGDETTSNTQMSFEDVNGDGYPDQVFKRDDLGAGGTPPEVRVKLNPVGAADRLIRVDGPAGGSFDISYARAGNVVRMADRVDMPDNRWVMSRVVVHSKPTISPSISAWNPEPDHITDYKYLDGFYDRNEREFLGFKTVTSTQGGVSEFLVVQDIYDTSDVYRKGRLLKRIQRKRLISDTTTPDNNLPVFDVAETQYETRTLQAAIDSVVEPREIKFVIDKTRLFRSYEGGSTNPDDTATLTRKETRDYDSTHGGLTSFTDDAGTTATADDIKYTVGYFQDTTGYIFKPNLVRALNSGGTQLRRREATYFTNGKLNTLTESAVGGRDPATGADYTGTIPSTWTFTYDTSGNFRTVTDPKGYRITANGIDAQTLSYPVALTDSHGYSWQQRFNHFTGALKQTIDPNGATINYNFDAHQRPSGVSDGAGTELIGVKYVPFVMPTQTTEGQPAGAVVFHRTAEGSETLTLADGFGRVIQTKKKAEVDNGSGTAVAGMIVSGTILRDAWKRKISQGQPVFRSGVTPSVNTTYDVLPNRNPTTFKYDALSREIQMDLPIATGARANTTKTIYDMVSFNGAPRSRQTVKDANQVDSEAGGTLPGQARETYRDARGRIIAIVEKNRIAGAAKTLVTEYEYDPLDRILKVFDAKENVTTAVWDSMNRMVSLTNPDTGRTRYDFDVGGNLGRKENANGKIIRYQYNFNRLEHVVYPDSAPVDIVYGDTTATNGGIGRITSRTDETGNTTFQYDAYGALKKTTWTAAPPAGIAAQPPYVTDYFYEPVFNSLRTLTSDGETYTYSYDAAGHVKSVSGRRGSTTTTYAGKILYNEFDQRTRVELGNGAITTYGYDAQLRRLTSVDTVRNSTVIQKLRYTAFDFVGNIKGLENQVSIPTNPAAGTVTPGPTVQSFIYDNLHQLTSATGTYTGLGSMGGRTYSLTIDYDEIGNITRKNQLDRNRPTAGAAQQTVTRTTYNNAYTYGSSRPHAATTIASSQSSQTATYDNDGNQLSLLASGIGRTMTWNEEDRLKTITAAGTTSTFLYTTDGERAIKRANVETHYPNPYLAVRVGGARTHNVMVNGDRIASVVVPASGSATTFYYHSDHLQSSGYTSDGAGNLTQHNEYFPSGETWVEELRGTGTANRQPYQFNSKELDDTGLYYYGARYYDPRQSQWISPDPILSQYVQGGGNGGVYTPSNLALYGYSWNNPVVLKDPDGKIVWFAVALGVAYGIMKSSGTVTQPTDGSEPGTVPTPTSKFIENVVIGTTMARTRPMDVVQDALTNPDDNTGEVGGSCEPEPNMSPIGPAPPPEPPQVEIVQRGMSEAELKATRDTGLFRGGRPGTPESPHFASPAVNNEAHRAQQRLALPQTPEVKVTMEVPKGRFGPPTTVKPKYNMPGGGLERKATGPVPVKILKVDRMK